MTSFSFQSRQRLNTLVHRHFAGKVTTVRIKNYRSKLNKKVSYVKCT